MINKAVRSMCTAINGTHEFGEFKPEAVANSLRQLADLAEQGTIQLIRGEHRTIIEGGEFVVDRITFDFSTVERAPELQEYPQR